MNSFDRYLSDLLQGHVFTEEEMAACISFMMRGDATAEQMTQFLIALSDRGETPEEIAGAARTLREKALTIKAPVNAVDCCGTGGDGAHTYNISTAVALVAAACGVPIAKHGNRASSSKSGAADVLEKLGVNLSPPLEKLEHALQKTNFCFLMASNHHQAMKHIAPVRKALGKRTIFNVLGPLANPAGTKKQLLGVYDRKRLKPMAQALKSLGTQRAMVVHGEDGLDEITLCGKTHAVFLHENGQIEEKTLTPDDFGLKRVLPESIRGGDVEENAGALLDLLNGKKSGYRDIVLTNAAAVLFLHDGRDFKQGVKDAGQAIDSKSALSVLESYKELTA
jgi:anthranilate phosphoribosyltransferase